MKISTIILILSIAQHSFAQISITRLSPDSIPKYIKYTGHIVNAVRWTDSMGDNLVITTETGETISKNRDDDAYRDAALYAYNYRKKGNIWHQTWRLYDYIIDCPLDLKANFIKNTFAITDLNKDKKAEVWLMYKIICHGDVSPSNMKIIMYEGGKKYIVRGTNRVQLSDKEFEGGKYTYDEAFKNGPESFRKYASQLWKKNIVETWE